MSRSDIEQLAAARRALAETVAQLEEERAARARAERTSAMKDEWLARVAHQLRNPLGVILGWAHLLRRRPAQEELDKGLDIIEQSVQVQARLIDELLDASRLASGQLRLDLQPIEPRSLIDAAVEAIGPAAQAREIGIRKVLDLTVRPVLGDATRLEQVLAQLLSNAVKFTPAKGSIEVALRSADRMAEISVSDTGSGIAPGLLPHVFERCRPDGDAAARRKGGLGLGLAIARQLAELHGGQLRAESQGEGRGATFVLRLPYAAGAGQLSPAER